LWISSDVLLNIKNRIQNIINRKWNSAARLKIEPTCSINSKPTATAVAKLAKSNKSAH